MRALSRSPTRRHRTLHCAVLLGASLAAAQESSPLVSTDEVAPMGCFTLPADGGTSQPGCSGDRVCVNNRCEHPAPTSVVEASTTISIEPPLTVLKDPVLTPVLAERRSRWSMGFAGQVVCHLADLTSRHPPGCFVGTRLSFDFYIGKLAFDFMFGRHLAFGIGLELGTPFFQLGGATSPVSLAVRAVARARVHGFPALIGGFGEARVGGGLGVTLSYALNHHTSVQFQLAPEFIATPRDSVIVSLDLNAWLGMRFSL